MTEQMFATAHGRSLPISAKQAIMICAYLRNKPLARAKAILTAAIKKKEAIPFTRFNNGIGHRSGIEAAGSYPLKASTHILALLESAEANAINKGMSGELQVVEIRANRASSPMRQGRQSRREAKRAHVHVRLAEMESKKSTKSVAPKKAKPESKETQASKKESAPAQATSTESKPKKSPSKTDVKEKASVKPKESENGN